MRKSLGVGRRPSARRAAWTIGVLAGLALVASPVGTADPDRTFDASIAPSNAVGGVSTTFDVTITNTAHPQTLGSATLTAPPGFAITAATLSGSGTIEPPIGPSTVRLRNLGLASGSSVTAQVTASAACPAGSHAWAIAAKESPDFGGNKTFSTDDALITTVSSPCRLAFGNQPADVETGVVLTAARLDPAGPPITVRALDGAGNLLASVAGNVNVALSPSAPALGGTTPRPLAGGIATFANLTVGTTGRSFTLTADSPNFVSATSSGFVVFNEGVLCPGNSCQGGAAGNRTTISVNATGLAGGTSLGILLLPSTSFPASVCGLFAPVGQGTFVDIRPLPGLTLTTVRLDKTLVNDKPTPNGAASFDLCVATNLPFTTKSGATSFFDGTRYWGLIPNCPKTISSPCMQSRNKDRSGDLILVGAVPDPYDPEWWGG